MRLESSSVRIHKNAFCHCDGAKRPKQSKARDDRVGGVARDDRKWI
ncbi:hypothetical protein [Helicobacter zhangjianzhongii]|nr:hypothetical protein [Helicobacter sp. CPD2-1]MDL0080479.1 hypothetical protein [Helicobacter sp. CPD2-1]